MDLERKLNKTKNFMYNFSTPELLFDKLCTGPPFVLKETDLMFILSAHLEGYKRENIKVEINKGEKQVAVIGEKPLQETAMVGNKVYSKEIVMWRFKRAFRFSEGVILDESNARFNQQEFLLTISIPKMERGFRGIRVEVVKQEEIGEGYEPLQVEENRGDETSTLENEKYKEDDDKHEKEKNKDAVEVENEELVKRDIVQELDETQIHPNETFKNKEIKEKQASIDPNKSQHVQGPDQIQTNAVNAHSDQETIRGEENKTTEEPEGAKKDDFPKIKKSKCKLCNPIVLGSTILVTISVFVIYFVRARTPHRKRKN